MVSKRTFCHASITVNRHNGFCLIYRKRGFPADRRLRLTIRLLLLFHDSVCSYTVFVEISRVEVEELPVAVTFDRADVYCYHKQTAEKGCHFLK